MSRPVPPSSGALGALGIRLRTAREAVGLTGTGLAELLGAGWKQSKVSKIELGKQLPTENEVIAWAAATGIGADAVVTLRAKAAAEYATYRERLSRAGGAVPRQEEITTLARSSTFLASYSPTMIPGRLQLPAYIRDIARSHEMFSGEEISDDELGSITAAKLRRQSILYEPGRTIIDIVGETALRTRVASTSVATLRSQLTHIAELSELSNYTFGVVPLSRPVPITPLAGWSMYDRDLVSVETPDGSLHITEPDTIARYVRWLDLLLEVALTGPDAAAFCLRIRDELAD